MDRISHLPDEFILRILSFLPAKDVVVTMILSKRWKFLWTIVPKLLYDDSYQNIEYERFSRFVYRSLFVREAPVIETLHFKLGKACGSGDIQVWIRAADKRCVRELIIEIDTPPAVTLPKSLYTCCKMLVTLKLNNADLVDADVSSSISFPSLKILHLVSVKYLGGDEFVKRLLSSCPVLEDLVVDKCPNDNMTIFTVRVPSLKSLFLCEISLAEAHGFVIDVPSLEYLYIIDSTKGFCVLENHMPKVVKAIFDVTYSHPWKILGSIASVKHLHLCLSTSKDEYPVGSVFCSLVYLKICTCDSNWLNLLMRLLRDSPNLRALKLEEYHPIKAHQPRPYWSEPSLVPECLLTSLETLEWVNYEGTKEEKEVVAFILNTANCLKKAIISSKSDDRGKKFEMLKEVALWPRCSRTCQLQFD